jgi:hypothetical protein
MLTDQALEERHIFLDERLLVFVGECKSTEFDHCFQQQRPV